MTNLIQDLLDYAQIKAGKFRKNLKRFNIHDTIEEIMSIQKRQAEVKNIRLYAEFKGFSQKDLQNRDGSVLPHNQIIYHDE